MLGESRFWAKVRVELECWLWTGVCDRAGYGLYWHEGRMIMAHRHAWWLLRGEDLPSRVTLRATCGRPNCVRPEHRNRVEERA